MNKIFTFFIASALFFSTIQNGQAQSEWSVKYEHSRSFIENKGQFNNPKVPGRVLYAWDDANTVVYFTTQGISFAFLKAWPAMEKEKEGANFFSTIEEWMEREKKERKMEFETDVVNMTWAGASADAILIPSELTADYHSYYVTGKDGVRRNVSYIKSYKKLTYKNIYPGIDVEYVFHPTEGLKYSLIVHPGADLQKVKMQYSVGIRLDAVGNLHIPTRFGDIIDHAPQSWDASVPSVRISSSFILNNNTVGFKTADINHHSTLIIDPWTQTPALPTSHAVMECERDAAGNVYIIGGEMPMQLLKYNSAGVLQWTHNTPYDTANFWLGTFATDLNGNSYVTAGSICRLEKVNTSNVVQWQWTPGGLTPSDEYWNIAFNCDQTRLIIGGTKGTGLTDLRGAIFDINTSDGSVNTVKIVGFGNTFAIPPIIEEVRSITSCRNARYYYMTLDTIGCIDDNFSVCPSGTPTIFAINHGYSLAYKCENYRPNNGNGGIMSIRANRYFVYTQNGITVDKRSLADGSILASAPIAGGISITTLGRHQVGNSGIDIDTCGNVYVGSGSAVIKYNSNLGVITSSATAYKVYDVAVSTAGNVIICGATGDYNTPVRTGYVESLNLSACKPMSLYCCDANVCPVGPVCNTAMAFLLTPATPGGTFSGPGITNPATGLFDPAIAGVGTHTIVYTLPCGSDSVTIVVNACTTLAVCQNPNGTLTVSNGTGPYTWEAGTDTVDCTTCLIGCIFPPGCAVPITLWTPFATGTTVTPPGTFPIRVTDAGSNVTVIDSNTVIPPCSNCPVTIGASPAVICSGQSSTLTASGGTTYVWQPGGMTGSSVVVTPSASTVYTVTGTTGSCTASASVLVTVNPLPVVTVSANPASICVSQTSTLTASGAGTYSWMPGSLTGSTIDVTPGVTTTYTVTGTLNGCTASASVTVIVGTSLAVNVSANPPAICPGQCTDLTATGASVYTWQPGSLSGSTVNVCPAATTTYSVYGDNAGCTGSQTITIQVAYPVISVSANPTQVCTGQCTALSASGATYYLWMPDTLTGNIVSVCPTLTTTYTVTGYNGPDCAASAAVTIPVVMDAPLVIPNVFTPNGDHKNDMLEVSVGPHTEFNLKIFNRWGKEVYQTSDPEKFWDGNIGKKPAADGPYFYICSYRSECTGEIVNRNGPVELVR